MATTKPLRVLVTGTHGYIGSRLAPLLLARGHQVVGLDTGLYRNVPCRDLHEQLKAFLAQGWPVVSVATKTTARRGPFTMAGGSGSPRTPRRRSMGTPVPDPA